MSKDLNRAAIVIVAGVLATTLAQTQVLAKLPLQNLLKNELMLDRTSTSAFFFWCGLAWYLKPLAGILTDAVPLFGTRRRSYMLLGAALATVFWLILIATPHTFGAMLTVVIAINIFMALASTATGGYMVETAQATAGSGRLTAIRQFVAQACIMANGPASGFLAAIAFGWTALACGGIMFLLIPATLFFLREPVHAPQSLLSVREQLVRIVRARTMWGAAGLMLLFYIAPGFSTAIFYKQQNDLHMTTQAQGFLQLLAGIFGVLAAVLYGYACRRLRLRKILFATIACGTLTNLAYLHYDTVANAQFAEIANAIGFTLAELALMDLAVRATPAGSEGLGFSLMVSVRNLAIFGTDWFGSALLDTYHVPFGWLVIANSATTAIVLPLIFLLPAAIAGHRDSEA
jgi:MFS family permease